MEIAPDTARNREIKGLPGGKVLSLVHNRKWLVAQLYPTGMCVWKLVDDLPVLADRVDLDTTALMGESSFSMVISLTPGVLGKMMAHCGDEDSGEKKPYAIVGDCDEMCIVCDKNSCCRVRFVDIRKCFESRSIVVAKEFCVRRDPLLRYATILDGVWLDRRGRIFVALWVTTKGQTLIQDVVTGKYTVLEGSGAGVSPVDESHYGLKVDPMQCCFYEVGTNELVKQWVGRGKVVHWSSGLIFIKEGELSVFHLHHSYS
ncbi:hypothetical protein Pelo_18192 [Pelomyxa schiedti]|nr:hypothetical protein Pelo_18192 [Pelomyxa schiedti]